MKIKLKAMFGCILFLLLTTSLLSHADDLSISKYVISKTDPATSGLMDIKIGWVTINLSSPDQNLTNDQRITVTNSRERYILDINNFKNLVRFYYDFINDRSNDRSEAIRQMSQFLTQIFSLNARNINRNNITEIQRSNMDFFYGINLNNARQGAANKNSWNKRPRRQAQRTNNAGCTDSATIGFDNFYSNPNDNLSCVNTGLALLLASFLEPWVRTNVQVPNNPLAVINDHLALTQQAFFNRVFQRVLSSGNLSSTSASSESTSRIGHEYDPFAFVTTENIVRFLCSTGADRDFVFATLLRSLSIAFASHLIHLNVFLRERQSTPEGINHDYPAADTMQISFRGYLRAHLQSRGVNFPFNCSFDFNCMQQMALESPQFSTNFWANLPLIHQRLADEESTLLFTRLTGTDTTNAAPPEAPVRQQAVANPDANQLNMARRQIAYLARLNRQLNDQARQGSSEESSSSEVCSVCLTPNRLVALIPCGHVATCNSCADTICRSSNSLCPLCRRNIIDIVKLYFNRNSR